ncbi:MAG TPA: acyl-CoA dehydratase activase [bacterium]|nr:acyl-CoA dehydratase activase [bacterium]
MTAFTAGIDVGSAYTKVVLAGSSPGGAAGDDGGRAIAARTAISSGYDFAQAAERGLSQALAAAGLPRDAVGYVAATGYGRYMVPFRDIAITELTCHAYAVYRLMPEVRTVLDVGGQTVKAIRLGERGRVKAFRLNDKCAAGSGAFLEKTMRYLGYQATDIASLTGAAASPVAISSVCAVFAESEVINHLTAGRSAEDVCAGAVMALAERAGQVFKRVRPEPQYALTGGLTRVPLLRRALEKALGGVFRVPEGELGVYAGALGAALLGRERARRLTDPRPA